ncbi:MAG: hypothetical protein FWE97_01215 [Dehalococcoidia bacterium]|nr:hypothetical protein [Dehalococcoidia bacterium]
MKRPPMLLRMRFHENSSWGLWLPLFLVYPLLLVVSLVALPFLLLAALVMWPLGRARLPLLLLPYAWNVIVQTRGLALDVHSCKQDVTIDFI